MFASAVAAWVLAATVIPQSIEQLTDKSTHVVRATVTRQSSAREPGPAGIYTRSTLRVDEALKGTAPKEIIVRQVGGVVGTQSLELPGDARLEPGEQVLVFLTCKPKVDHCVLIGLSQGKFHLEASGANLTASRDFAHTAFVNGAPLSGEPVDYARLATQVRARARESSK